MIIDVECKVLKLGFNFEHLGRVLVVLLQVLEFLSKVKKILFFLKKKDQKGYFTLLIVFKAI